MTKQEEIREGIAEEVRHHFGSIQHTGMLLEELVADHILSYLHSQGVVIAIQQKAHSSLRVYEPLIK